ARPCVAPWPIWRPEWIAQGFPDHPRRRCLGLAAVGERDVLRHGTEVTSIAIVVEAHLTPQGQRRRAVLVTGDQYSAVRGDQLAGERTEGLTGHIVARTRRLLGRPTTSRA